MQLYNCASCGNVLYFENVECMRCGAKLGFLPERLQLATIVVSDPLATDPIPSTTTGAPANPAGSTGAPTSEPTGQQAGEMRATRRWQPLGEPRGDAVQYRMCINYADYAVCNWMVPVANPASSPASDQAASSDEGPDRGAAGFCTACALNGTIPDLTITGNMARWRTMETEKHRLVYSLLQLGLPVVPRQQDPAGLEFAFLADTPSRFHERDRVMTGHAQGLITINLAEADPVERERMRGQMAEPYRTILGHFRHESGHYYWDRLIRDTPWLAPFRDLFGDESVNYNDALAQHYRDGPPADWQDYCVSAYASAHPWEDWAETWAHYLHMVDALETAYQFGLSIRPRANAEAALIVERDFNPYHAAAFESIIADWVPLTLALNSLNRSVGHEHAYPFVLSARVVEKLAFVHRVIRDAAKPGTTRT